MNEGEDMKCPHCEYHTRPLAMGRMQRMIRNTLLKHLIKIHGYSHDGAVAKLEELGYATPGMDLAEFTVQFEAFGGSL